MTRCIRHKAYSKSILLRGLTYSIEHWDFSLITECLPRFSARFASHYRLYRSNRWTHKSSQTIWKRKNESHFSFSFPSCLKQIIPRIFQNKTIQFLSKENKDYIWSIAAAFSAISVAFGRGLKVVWTSKPYSYTHPHRESIYILWTCWRAIDIVHKRYKSHPHH